MDGANHTSKHGAVDGAAIPWLSRRGEGGARTQVPGSATWGRAGAGRRMRQCGRAGEGQCSAAELGLLFEELAVMISEFKFLCERSHFVLVPGPNDPGAPHVPLPRPLALRHSSTNRHICWSSLLHSSDI